MDCTKRIEEIFKEEPDLENIVDRKELEDVCKRQEQGFDSDADYFKTVRVMLIIKAGLLDFKSNMKDLILGKVYYVQGSDERKSVLGKKIIQFTELYKLIETVYKQRKEITGKKEYLPRLMRLTERNGLSNVEVDILNYLIIYYSDVGFSDFSCTEDDIKGIAKFFNLDSSELMGLLSNENKLVQEGIFSIEEASYKTIFDRDIKMSISNIKALRGFPLTQEEFLKIEGTSIAEILKEEPGFNLTEGSGIKREKNETDDDEDAEDDIDDELDKIEREMEKEDEDDKENGEDESEEKDEDDEFELHEFLKKEAAGEEIAPGKKGEDSVDRFGPYTNDIDYFQDRFEWLANKLILRKAEIEGDIDREYRDDDRSKESIVRELKARERMLSNKCNYRMELTKKQKKWMPRLEKLCKARGYDEFEKNVITLLIGGKISPKLDDSRTEIKEILMFFCDDLQKQVECRKYFYKNSMLVRDGVIRVDGSFRGLVDVNVEIDRRMMDYLLGLETELSELVEGSHLYTPKVKLNQVILPEAQKSLILNTAKNFDSFKSARKKLGFEEIIPYGNSLVMLFYGPSGTGKTMMGNALANHLNRRILLINFPSLGNDVSDQVVKYIFREAKINDAIIFFDECEGIFEARDRGNPGISLLLTEFERHDGLILMATNRPQVLDEAMHRRITMAVHFGKPDHHLRKEIWKVHLPPKVKLDKDIDFDYLAYNYELTGGLIKNAVITALSVAVQKNAKDICISHGDLETGAKLQLKGHLRMGAFENKVTPVAGMEALVLQEKQIGILKEILNTEKSKKVLFGRWGFQEGQAKYYPGTTILFHGPSGTGKTFAAEVLGYELGQPIMRINTAQVISMWVGETAKNIDAIFEQAKQSEAILLFDEADALFSGRTAVSGANDRYANVDVNVLLQAIENFEGIAVLTTNIIENIDKAMFRRFRYILEFPVPDASLRVKLWEKLIPEKAPREKKIDFKYLAKNYELTGGHIKNAVFKAASVATLRLKSKQRITQKDLEKAAGEEISSFKDRTIGFGG